MAAKAPIWGIDIGQSSIKAIKLQAAGAGVEILDVAVVDHASLLSAPDADVAGLIKASMDTLVSKHDLRGQRVVVAVPGQQTLTRFTKLPPVEAKKIPDLVTYEAQTQIPFDMDEVVWDYSVFSAKDSPDVEVGIFAIRKELIRSHLSHFTSVGLEPVAVQTAPIASYNAMRFDGQFDDRTTLVLHMGALATDLIIIEGERLWSRPIPTGGNSFTESLIHAFKLSFAKAEQLKRAAATSKYARQIFQAMRPVYADLVSEVQRSIGLYTSTHRQSQIQRVVALGMAFSLPGFQKFLQQNLQLQVDKFGGFQKAGQTPAVQTPTYTDNVLSLATAYGCALQGLGLAPIASSLLPMEIERAQLWAKKRPFFAAAAACLVGAAGAVWLGNIMAGSALAAKAGTVTSPTPRVPPNAETAARLLSSPPNRSDTPPLEYAVTVYGAIQKLKETYDRLPKVEEVVSKTKAIAELPTLNVMIPQIIDVVHQGFAAMSAPELRAAKSLDDYLAVARRVPRSERKEVWIEDLQLKFDPRDPASAFSMVRRPVDAEGGTGEGNAGWAMKIEGRTTLEHPAAWLGELVQKLEREGCKKDRGFWFQKVELRNVSTVGDERRGPGRSAPPAASVGGSDRERGRPSAPVAPAAGAPNLNQAVRDLEMQKGVDPVTGEATPTDSTFTIAVLVKLGKAPDDVIKKREQGVPSVDPSGAAPASPTTPPARGADRD